MLCRCNLVMLCLCRHTQLPKLYIQFVHEAGNSFLNTAEIMVVHLLPLRRSRTKKSTPCKNQVFSFLIKIFVNQEIFLLCAAADRYLFRSLVAEQTHNTHCLSADRFTGTQQRCFFIQCFACVGIERRRDIQGNPCRILTQKCRRGTVPSRIAARLEGRTQTAGGEGGRIGFPLNQLLSGKFHNCSSVGGRR